MPQYLSRPMTRRALLRLAPSAALFSSLPSSLRGAAPDPDAVDTISIFHSTDLHGHILPTSNYDGTPDLGGLARCASILKAWRKEHPHHLTIDVGDLYQGTDLSLRSQGALMVNCLNHLDYDAWVIGNHELDWGIEAVHAAVARSRMPVLAANVELHDRRVWDEDQRADSTLAPFLLQECGGYKIAIVALTTPNMANWFLPDLTRGFAAHDPVPVLRQILAELEPHRPDAILLACHMGVRPWSREDDSANRLFALTAEFPQIDAIIAGHTHQDQASRQVNGIAYTQASYFGIHLGHLKLHFDPASRKLVGVDPTTTLVDGRFELDPEILALARDDIDASKAHLATTAGQLGDELTLSSAPGRPSHVERLIGSSILDGLRRRDIHVDAAIHGLLFAEAPIPPGEKTVADMWGIIPFENFIVTAQVTRPQLIAILQEVYGLRNHRSIIGLMPTLEGRGDALRVTSIRSTDGHELPDDAPIHIALNSYDAASGGDRFPILKEILSLPEARRTLHRLQSRALLIEYFQNHSPITLATLHP
jgi:5'-nucleotidase / UDP-sugar diphosphatase